MLKVGVAAIFGPQSAASADHIRSMLDSVEIPFIDTRWNYKPSARILGTKSEEYTINLHPDVETLSRAYMDIIEHYGWKTITILYENNDSMMRMKAIFDRTSNLLPIDQFAIITRELVMNENGYRDVSMTLKKVYHDLFFICYSLTGVEGGTGLKGNFDSSRLRQGDYVNRAAADPASRHGHVRVFLHPEQSRHSHC